MHPTTDAAAAAPAYKPSQASSPAEASLATGQEKVQRVQDSKRRMASTVRPLARAVVPAFSFLRLFFVL